MKFFKGLVKLLEHLTKEEDQVSCEEVQGEPKVEKEPMVQDLPKQQPTTEETNLETKIENHQLNQVRDWAMNKIELLHEADRHRNANALLAEFDEWINIPEGTEELEYLCLEDEDWTDDQEVDVR